MDAAQVVDAVQIIMASGVLGQGLAAMRWATRVEARVANLERCEEARKRRERARYEVLP